MKITKTLSLFSIIILLVLLCFYVPVVQKNDDPGIFIADSSGCSYIPQGNGTAYGLVSDDRKHLVEERQFLLNKKNEELKLNFMLSNGTKQDNEYLIIPMVNYSFFQIKISNKMKNNVRVKLKSNQLVAIPVTLMNFNDGINDVIFLIVKNPDSTDISDAYRRSTELQHVIGLRLSAIVGEPAAPKIAFKEFEPKDNTVLTGLFLTDTKSALKQWLTAGVKNNEQLDFFVNVGNFKASDYSYALVSMYNWKQVPSFGSDSVIFGKLQSNKAVQIEAKINVEHRRKISNYTTILIPYPYKIYERNQPMDIEAGTRVALIEK